MRTAKGVELRVSNTARHFFRIKQPHLILTTLLTEFTQNLHLCVTDSRNEGARFIGPQACGASSTFPSLARRHGHFLNIICLPRKARMSKVLNGRTYWLLRAVNNANGQAFFLSKESGGKANDAASDNNYICFHAAYTAS